MSEREALRMYAVGSVHPTIYFPEVKAFHICIPDRAEQDAIAEVLCALDNKIELNRQMNATLEATARLIFSDWFVDFGPTRAKIEGQPPYFAPDLWALFPSIMDDQDKPSGWQVSSVADISSRVSIGPFGSDITTDNFVGQGVPVIRGANLKDGFVDDEFVYLTDAKADTLRNAIAFAQDVVLTHRGTLGQVGIIPDKPRFERYVISQSQMLVSANRSLVSPRFLFEFLRSAIGQQQLLANTSQTGVPAIARPTTSLKSLRLVVPDRRIISAFDELTKPLISRINSNLAENHKLVQLRDLLLPKLVSGQVRLIEAQDAMENVA